MEIRPDKRELLKFVDGAVEGELALPQFQRNFVWSRDDITDLLLSIFKGYFIGSLLLLRVSREHSPFGLKHIATSEKAKDRQPIWLILDGQQRITSLHYVFAAPDLPLKGTKYPYRFFLNLSKLLETTNGELSDDLVFSERTAYCGEKLEREYQFNELVIPMTDVRTWSKWQAAYERWLIERDKEMYFDFYLEKVKPIWDKARELFESFPVPYIEIPEVADDDKRKIGEICAVFEKLNSTGVSLSVFDLMTARLYKHDIDLHKLWDRAIAACPKLNEFSEGKPDGYGVLLLRTIALIRGSEVRGKSLINMEPEGFESDWKKAVDFFELALKRVTSISKDGFGVVSPAWQPYSTMVPVLAALLAYGKEKRLGHEFYADLRKWYWGSAFLERYAGAVDSTTYSDYLAVLRRMSEKDKLPEVFREINQLLLNNTEYSLREVARKNSVYRGVMNLIALNGAKDFRNNDGISFQELDDHHIFPRAYLKKEHDLDGSDVNTILNRTLISSDTNRTISRKAPSEYLKDVIPDDHRESILRSHLIGPEAQEAMARNDYDAFLKAREQDILDYLRTFLDG